MRRLLAGLVLLLGPATGFWFAAQAPVHILIMHTNDLHGQLLPKNGVGGIAEIATIVRAARPDLMLDAGDISTGTFLSDEFRGEPTIQAMNRIGYTSGTIGNHEFDYGQDALRKLLRDAKFPVLSANLKTPIKEIRKYTVVTVKGIRFGIIGLTTEEVKLNSHPKNTGGVTVLDTVKTLEQLLPEVRRKSDFIIATVHLENEEDMRIASAFPEIRLIIAGHVHDTLGPIWAGQTLIAKTGSIGQNVGRVDLDFSGKKLVHMEGKLIPVKNVDPDPGIASVLNAYNLRVKAKTAQIVGEAAEDLVKSDKSESALADVVADAFREKGQTQIAIQNIGGIRARISKGLITWGNVFEVLPFENTMITVKMTGAQVRKTLLRGLAPTIGMVSLSGLRVHFDLSKQPGEQIVSAILLDGSPLDDSKLYSVTTNDFVAAGGDGFTEFMNAIDRIDTGIYLRDVLVEYIKMNRVLKPKLDGRIIVDN
jgi:2',3'-cyclic-nucleotide 2'-phosphodiesterase/3'-nucleotidase